MFLPIYLCALLLLSKDVLASDEHPMHVDIYSPSDSEEPTCHGVLIDKKWVLALGSCKKELPLRLTISGTMMEATIENEDDLMLITDNIPVPVMFLKFPQKEISPKMADISYRSYGFDEGLFGQQGYGYPRYGQQGYGYPRYGQQGYGYPRYGQRVGRIRRNW